MAFPPHPAWSKDAVMSRPSMVQDSLFLHSVLETLRIGKLTSEDNKGAQVPSPQWPCSLHQLDLYQQPQHHSHSFPVLALRYPFENVLHHHSRCPCGFRRRSGWLRCSILRVPIGSGLQERHHHRCPFVDHFRRAIGLRFDNDYGGSVVFHDVLPVANHVDLRNQDLHRH